MITTKVKGHGYVPLNRTINTNLMKKDKSYIEKNYQLDPNIDYKILDTADYVIPANEYNSIFIMTNFIKTDQIQEKCDEEPEKYKAKCETDEDWKKLGSFMAGWNGKYIFKTFSNI